MNAQLDTVDDLNANSSQSSAVLCFHCSEPVPVGTKIFARIKQHDEAMCCEGCRAVAQLITSAGLQDYYQYRNQPAVKPDTSNDEWALYAQPDIASQHVRHESAATCSAVILVDGIRCSACSWLIDRMLRRNAAIKDVNVNVATAHVRVVWQGNPSYFADVLRALSAMGYKPHALDAQGIQQQSDVERRSMLRRLGVSGVGMMQVMMYVLPMYVHSDMDAPVRHYLQLVGMLLTTPVLLYAGWPILSSAMRAIKAVAINMDVPVAIALLLAYGASVWNTFTQHGDAYFDSVSMFIFLLTLSRFVVMTVRHRSHSVSDALIRIQPRIAHRVRDDIVEEVPVNQLAINDIVLVRVGEAFPADGVIIDGKSKVDESLLTGESLPIDRNTGDKVLAGSLNVETASKIRVTQLGQQTILAGVLALLEQAQTDKPRGLLIADRISRWFLNSMLVTVVAVALVWWWIDPSRVFNTVLAVLVITCPCALSLAAPAVIAAATTALARRGLLITHANAIEQLAHVRTMVFDKTGTLTAGKVSVTNTSTFGSVSADECLRIAAALEQSADHPVARAFNANTLSLTSSNIRVVAGRGVEGVINGTRYRLGNLAFVNELIAQPLVTEDDHPVWLGSAQSMLACFELSDVLRSEVPATIQQLHALQVDCAVLSGDAEPVVKAIAHQSNIAEYHSRQSPADKVNTLHRYQQQVNVAMVGDGINDAPVLGAASVSIAMGAGTSLAQASADAVLMNNSLTVLPAAISLARRAQHIMRQNLWWAAIYNLGAVPLAALGYITPWVAAAGMSLSSILVVLNATRILRVKTS